MLVSVLLKPLAVGDLSINLCYYIKLLLSYIVTCSNVGREEIASNTESKCVKPAMSSHEMTTSRKVTVSFFGGRKFKDPEKKEQNNFYFDILHTSRIWLKY